MQVRTNRYGMTILKGDIAQVSSLETRVTKVLATYGMRSPRVHARACELVRSYPELTAVQAVEVAIARL